MSANGMVATTHPLVAISALSVLQAGGNAADAAAAAGFAMNVMEPFNSGLGGDMFALVWWAKDRQVYSLNGSGPAPAAASIDELRQRGVYHAIPETGMLPVTVPGAVDGIASLLERFGTMTLSRVLEPAIGYAERGYPVPEKMADQWQMGEALLGSTPEAAAQYLIDGKAPRAGQVMRLPHLARTLRVLGEGGRDAFYNGPIAEAIVRYSETHGGLLSLPDLAGYRAEWTEPICTEYRGARLYECPPNGQGIIALEALNLLEGFDLSSSGFGSVDTLHLQIEALRLAFADAFAYVADPRTGRVPTSEMLSADFIRQRLRRLDPHRARPNPPPHSFRDNDTVYVTVVDKDRNAVSFISSLYLSFGSGLVAGDTGIFLQDRGACFSMEPGHPNALAPGKRPFQTIIPPLATRDDSLWLCFGVVGGFMQPQGHVQLMSNLVDYGMGVQTALDAPRSRLMPDGSVTLEHTHDPAVWAGLEARGHSLTPGIAHPRTFGGAQIIAVDPDSGALLGGSDPRKDGCAVGF
jgi:gamma-glutamyltranspeptidase/glutathione hydrolase